MKRSLCTLLVALQWTFLSCCAQTSPPSASGAAAAAALTNLGLPIVSVVNFGATGDGSTDDTAAINAAMTACVSKAAPKNGCTLYFPSGVYITTGLTLKPFLNMKGDGWAASVIQLKPATKADVVTIPIDAFNFSIYGLTLDGNSAHNSGSGGNCFSTAKTSTGPAEWNTANKHTAAVNAQKWGHIEEVMFSNCTADGIHINPYNYMLFFDNFYVYKNGVYGVYTQGTNSGFSNFQIERNGTAGIHIANANNRFTSGEVIWNGERSNSEAAVYVSGGRNIIMAVEAEDNYTSGFFDNGSDDEFIGCVSDSNGYSQKSSEKSSRNASGFIVDGRGGVYIGDKVTSYRGRLPDGNFATEWPYTVRNPNQASLDISSDAANQPPRTATANATLPAQVGSSGAGHVVCIKSAGPPPVIGFCSTAPNSKGACACN